MIPNESPEHPEWCAPATDACSAKYGYTQLVSPDVNLWPPLSETFHLCSDWRQREMKILAINGNICKGWGKISCQVTFSAVWLGSNISTRYCTFCKLLLFHTDKNHAAPCVAPPPPPARAWWPETRRHWELVSNGVPGFRTWTPGPKSSRITLK